MEIVMSEKVCRHEPVKRSQSQMNLKELKNEFLNLLKSKGKQNPDECIEIDGEQMRLKNVSPIEFHSLTLLLEKFGKEVHYQKQTVLKVI